MSSAHLRLADDVPAVPRTPAPPRPFRVWVYGTIAGAMEAEVDRLHLYHPPLIAAAMLRSLELSARQRRAEAGQSARWCHRPWRHLSFTASRELVREFRGAFDAGTFRLRVCDAIAGLLRSGLAMTPDDDVPLCGTLAALRRLQFWTEGKPWRPQPWPAEMMPDVSRVDHVYGEDRAVIGRIGFAG